MRVIWASLALAIGGCGLFLEDLSSGEAPESDDGGAARDVSTAEPDASAETSDATADAEPDADGGAADTGVDAPAWTPRLDCDATVLCEGFESISNIQPGQPCGVFFDQIDENNGEASIETNNPALGMRAARFVSLANQTGAGQTLLIGDNDVGLSGKSTIDVDFDLWLDYDPAAFDGSERRNLVGIFIESSKTQANWEFAGLSVMAGKGLHAEVREFASAASTVKKGAEDPHVELLGQPQLKSWHHVRLEVTFAKTATGGIKAYVDGALVGQLPALLTRTNASDGATKFIFWIGASAGVGSPPLTAIYDDVEVRTR